MPSSSLIKAIQANNINIQEIKHLLDSNKDLLQKDQGGVSPIMFAALRDAAVLKELLEYASTEQVNAASPNTGMRALHFAASKGKTECVQCLLKVPGIIVSPTNHAGYTPIMLAVENGHEECVKLLGSDSDLDQTSVLDKKNVFDLAEGNSRIFSILIEALGQQELLVENRNIPKG